MQEVRNIHAINVNKKPGAPGTDPNLLEPVMIQEGISYTKLFTDIQIQTIQFCNLKCSFCPNHYMIWDRIADKKKGIPYKKMSFELYEKIMKNLKEINFKGRVSPYLMNEPLIDKDRMVRFIEITREYLPEAVIVLNTNGTGLTTKLLVDMIEAGLDHIQIDDYLGERYFQKILKEVHSLFHVDKNNIKLHTWKYQDKCELIISSNYNVEQIKSPVKDKDGNIVRNKRGNPVSDPKPTTFPYTYWNRGGLVKLNEDIPVPNKDCSYPSRQMYINFEGDALLCCCDWEEMVVMGNANKERLEHIWVNKKYKHYRKTLLKGERKKLEMCRKCNKGGCDSEAERNSVKATQGLFQG
tara:strand:+ start:300 stop:1358 length:1059 start_codon:yes stop_codon:yes gene_type:complete